MNYLVAVLSIRMQAEAAYSALEKEGLPGSQVDILGSGYKSADDYGLLDPSREARKGTKRQLYWLVPFGFVAGFAFNVLTGIDIIPSLPQLVITSSVEYLVWRRVSWELILPGGQLD